MDKAAGHGGVTRRRSRLRARTSRLQITSRPIHTGNHENLAAVALQYESTVSFCNAAGDRAGGRAGSECKRQSQDIR
jgi:hypothetical protein